MAKWISDSDVEKIVEVILKWPLWKSFGWVEIRQGAMASLKMSNAAMWSRQTLSKIDKITDAYETKKKQIRVNKGKYKENDDLPPRERTLQERVDAYEAKVLHLTSEIDGLHEKFERWQYNAYAQGVTEAMLERPLTIANMMKKKNKEHKFFKDLSS